MATERQKQKPNESLRDRFAGQALMGICANPLYVGEIRGHRTALGLTADEGDDMAAKQAYALADAMLRARGEHA